MTSADLRILARVLGALLPHRTVGQCADDPQEVHHPLASPPGDEHLLAGIKLNTIGPVHMQVPVKGPLPA